MKEWFGREKAALTNVGLAVLRVGVGALMLTHGWGKMVNFGKTAASGMDPIGLGPGVSAALLVFAEVFCALAIILGLFTRLAAIPPIIAMAVAFFVYHAEHAFRQKELALFFMIAFAAVMLLGVGKYSADALLFGRGGGSDAPAEAEE